MMSRAFLTINIKLHTKGTLYDTTDVEKGLKNDAVKHKLRRRVESNFN